MACRRSCVIHQPNVQFTGRLIEKYRTLFILLTFKESLDHKGASYFLTRTFISDLTGSNLGFAQHFAPIWWGATCPASSQIHMQIKCPSNELLSGFMTIQCVVTRTGKKVDSSSWFHFTLFLFRDFFASAHSNTWRRTVWLEAKTVTLYKKGLMIKTNASSSSTRDLWKKHAWIHSGCIQK